MPDRYETENEFGSGTVLSWASILDDNCREQAEAISRSPIVKGHLALMPDAHFGFGPPVGSVFIMEDAVMPYAVGVDIGCGMIAVRTNLKRKDLFGVEDFVLGNIGQLIPSGVGQSHQTVTLAAEEFFDENGPPPGIKPRSKLANKRGLLVQQFTSLLDRARIQFGTLGAGNHFVEVCVDSSSEGRVWLLLHSGSRGIGNVLATAHVYGAQEFCKANGVKLENRDFAYFMGGTQQFRAYLDDMLWAQNYAYQQRAAMMEALVQAVQMEIGDFETDEPINCHHNYAEEISDGSWLVRKGAINAEEGRMGIIPGSMGSATYIVRGRGDTDSYQTSPHGAGRVMGRGRPAKGDKPATGAYAKLNIDDFRLQMQGKTWLHGDAEQLLDEAPSAYKPIETVIEDSRDLVEPVTVLSQFINYKGL